MPRVCKLCSHARRSEIDRFMAHGHTFKQFREKFGDAGSIYSWSRHKAHVANAVEARESEKPAEETEDLACGLDVGTLRTINRKLKVLALRAEKTGKPQAAIAAYGAISRNLETLQKFTANDGSNQPEAPTIHVHFRAPEEVELTRAKARAELQKLEPANPMLQDQDQPPAAMVPREPEQAQPRAQSAEPEPEPQRSSLEAWEKFGESLL